MSETRDKRRRTDLDLFVLALIADGISTPYELQKWRGFPRAQRFRQFNDWLRQASSARAGPVLEAAPTTKSPRLAGSN